MSSVNLIARCFYFFHLKSFFKQPPEKWFTTEVMFQTHQNQNSYFIQSHGLLIPGEDFFGFE